MEGKDKATERKEPRYPLGREPISCFTGGLLLAGRSGSVLAGVQASTLAKASEKAYLIHWTDEVIQRPSVPGHRTKR